MGQGITKLSNLRKAYYYMKKNGLKSAYYAAAERIMREKGSSYRYVPPEAGELAVQKEAERKYPYRFSILVPAYETQEGYLREMVDSVLGQSYGRLELIIADASRSRQVETVAGTYADSRVRYIRLPENKGIAENTNRALEAAEGDYIGLLDHDDVLAPDALFQMAQAIAEKERKGNAAWLLYSDEDKGNGEMTAFYEPHLKPKFNMDLLLSNNYICHFLVMKRELMQGLGFRAEYDGAQDYDLVLRAAGQLLYDGRRMRREGRRAIAHVPSVLYHWRCHGSSTAENPESKRYAYEAGKRALEDFLKSRGWDGTVCHTRHLGFYRIDYRGDIFAQREEVGVETGKVLDRRGKICGGAYGKDGKALYAGLHKNFSGYMHRAVLRREVYAPDIRHMRVRKELWAVFEEVFGLPYRENPAGWFDYAGTAGRRAEGKGTDMEIPAERKRQCMEFGRRVREAGYTVVWRPGDT